VAFFEVIKGRLVDELLGNVIIIMIIKKFIHIAPLKTEIIKVVKAQQKQDTRQ